MNSSNELETNSQQAERLLVDDEQAIIAYLNSHPDFFVHHEVLLSRLDIPHASGEAVSLIERQVTILREKNAELKNSLEELVNIAKENDSSNRKLHRLILALLSANSLTELSTVLNTVLRRDFSTDAAALKLFMDADQSPENDPVYVASDSSMARSLEKLLIKRKPACGFFKNLPVDELFSPQHASIHSMAVLPLFVEKNHCFGALIIGSGNVKRFNPDMGTVFLERLGDIVSHIIHNFLAKKP